MTIESRQALVQPRWQPMEIRAHYTTCILAARILATVIVINPRLKIHELPHTNSIGAFPPRVIKHVGMSHFRVAEDDNNRIAVSSSFGTNIKRGAGVSRLNCGNSASSAARSTSNSRSTTRAESSLPFVMARKCGLRISVQGFSSPAAQVQTEMKRKAMNAYPILMPRMMLPARADVNASHKKRPHCLRCGLWRSPPGRRGKS